MDKRKRAKPKPLGTIWRIPDELWAIIEPILEEFTRRTGYDHRYRQKTQAHYTSLLQAMGKSQAEVEAAIQALQLPR